MIPDWDWHLAALTSRQIRLLIRLDTARTDNPILWALCIGHRTASAISNALAFPTEIVTYELRRYKRQGLIADAQAPSSVVWRITDDDLLELYDFVREIKRSNKQAKEEGGDEGH